MKKKLSALLSFFWSNLPLLGVIIVGVVVATINIDKTSSYSGWDNIIAEFDLVRYARQVFFGAWTEHQSFGAPAAQGQLSEVTRLPILFLLKFLLPDNLLRYSYIFGAYVIGGIGMYFYVSKVWLKGVTKLENWLGMVAGIYYLLHVLTLQQFYISFEMFMAQFAFLPFLLILLHQFIPKNKQVKLRSVFTIQNILLFILVQFLLAPSAHTQTVFYLGVLFSLVYMMVISWHQGMVRALLLSFLIGLMTFVTNVHWIIPNIYYGIHNAHYVSDSRDNYLFGPESVGSIKDASTFSNLTSGTQYLFNWKDYSFSEKQFHFIFNEWNDFLTRVDIELILQAFGLITLLGLFTTILDKDVGPERLAVSYVYVFCLALIWLDLFPTGPLLDLLYQNDSFLEAFRNPFTKLSIIYSFVSILLFIHVVTLFADYLSRKRKGIFHGSVLAIIFVFSLSATFIYTAWPTFQGNFISEKLTIQYPDQYFEMFDYLKTRDRDLRVLQLPQLSHAGWEYYDWQFMGEGNGYQGMGFYFFGFPQAFVNRDSDRWVETSDFFYHELKYALDKKDATHFKTVLSKYNIDIIVVDETKIDATMKHDVQLDHQLVAKAGLEQVWQKDFLTIYERQSSDSENELILPIQIKHVSAQTDRVRKDVVYQNEGDYIVSTDSEADIFYPFNKALQHQLSDLYFLDDTTIRMNTTVPSDSYLMTIPGNEGKRYKTPAQLSYDNGIISVQFPENSVQVDQQTISLPQLPDFEIGVEENYASLIVFFNNQGVVLSKGHSVQPVLDLEVGQVIEIKYAHKPADLVYTAYGVADKEQLDIKEGGVLEINWDNFVKEIKKEVTVAETIAFHSIFPLQDLNTVLNPSINCSQPRRGSIETTQEEGVVTYTADKYGVNCNGYGFEYASTAYSYLLNVTGNNELGRGIKLFVNYSNPEIVYEDYLFTDGPFNETIALLELSDNATHKFHLNWETRSFGKESKDALSSMKLGAFPLSQVSQIKFEKSASKSAAQENKVVIKNQAYYLDSIHLIDFSCESEDCFIGIDQTYDDLWLGFMWGGFESPPHYRYNNWANMWQVAGNGMFVVVYLPELLSLLGMVLLGTTTMGLFIVFVGKKMFKKLPKKKQPKKKVAHKVKQRLKGEL